MTPPAARNACLDHVTGDWVLWLDAGERVTPETAEAIRRFVDEAANPARVYLAMVELPATGEHQMVEQAGRVRLMPNKPGLRFTGRVRENLRNGLAAFRMEIEPTPWRIQRSSSDFDASLKTARARPRPQANGIGIGRARFNRRKPAAPWRIWPVAKPGYSWVIRLRRAIASAVRLPLRRAARPKCWKPIMAC